MFVHRMKMTSGIREALLTEGRTGLFLVCRRSLIALLAAGGLTVGPPAPRLDEPARSKQ